MTEIETFGLAIVIFVTVVFAIFAIMHMFRSIFDVSSLSSAEVVARDIAGLASITAAAPDRITIYHRIHDAHKYTIEIVDRFVKAKLESIRYGNVREGYAKTVVDNIYAEEQGVNYFEISKQTDDGEYTYRVTFDYYGAGEESPGYTPIIYRPGDGDGDGGAGPSLQCDDTCISFSSGEYSGGSCREWETEEIPVENGDGSTTAHEFPAQFHGVNIMPTSQRWEGKDIRTEIKKIKSWGFNAIRFHGMRWGELTPDRYDVVDESYFTTFTWHGGIPLDEWVRICTEEKIYLMLDITYFGHPWNICPDWAFDYDNDGTTDNPGRSGAWDFMMSGQADKELESLKNIWVYIAERYDDNPYVIFDIFNEPQVIDTPSASIETLARNYKDFHEDLIREVRAVEKTKHIIVIEVYNELNIPDNIEGDQWVYRDTHFYYPWERQYSPSQYQSMKNHLQNRYDELSTTGLNVQVGEFGRVLYPEDEREGGDEEWVRDAFRAMEEVGIDDWYYFAHGGYATPPRSYGFTDADGTPLQPYFDIVTGEAKEGSSTSVSEAPIPPLKVKGTDIVDANGNAFRLKCLTVGRHDRHRYEGRTAGLTSAQDIEEAWFNPDVVENIKNMGANCIDLHLNRWQDITDADGNIKESYFRDWIDEWVQWVTDEGMHTIINMGSFSVHGGALSSRMNYATPEWIYTDYPDGENLRFTYEGQQRMNYDFFDTTNHNEPFTVENRRVWIDAWTYIAERYADNPYVMYALINEPLHHTWRDQTDAEYKRAGNGYSEICSDAIISMREKTNKIVFVDMPYLGNKQTDDSYVPDVDADLTNVVWERHKYITHDDTNTVSKYVNEVQPYVDKVEKRFGKPLYIGEFGLNVDTPRHIDLYPDWENIYIGLIDWFENTDLDYELTAWGYYYGYSNYMKGVDGLPQVDAEQADRIMEIVFGGTPYTGPVTQPPGTQTIIDKDVCLTGEEAISSGCEYGYTCCCSRTFSVRSCEEECRDSGFAEGQCRSVGSYTSLHVKGTKIVDENGREVVLKGISVGHNDMFRKEGEHGSADSYDEVYFDEMDAIDMKDHGTTHIDLHAIWPTRFMEDDGDIDISFFKNWFDHFVDYCEDNEIPYIINMASLRHSNLEWGPYAMPQFVWRSAGYSDDWWKDENARMKRQADIIYKFFTSDQMETSRQKWFNAWKFIADRYGDNEYLIGLSLTNEPTHFTCGKGHLDYDQCAELGEGYSETIERCIDEIRSTGSNHIIFVDRPYLKNLDQIQPVDRDNIVWEAHKYHSSSTPDIESGWKPVIDDYVDKFMGVFGKPLYIGEYSIDPISFKRTLSTDEVKESISEQVGYMDSKSIAGMCFFTWGRLDGRGWADWKDDWHNEEETTHILQAVFEDALPPATDGGCEGGETDIGQDGCTARKVCCCSGGSVSGDYKLSTIISWNDVGGYRVWDDSTFTQYVDSIKALGMGEIYIIAVSKRFLDGEVRREWSDEQIEGVLEVCDAKDIDVYLGLHWMKHGYVIDQDYKTDEAHLQEEMAVQSALMDEMFSKFGHHPSFTGWYVHPEMGCLSVSSSGAIDRFTRYWSLSVEHSRGKPVVVSTYRNADYGEDPSITPAEVRSGWESMFTNTGVDGIIWVDHGGLHETAESWASTRKHEGLEDYFPALKQACESTGTRMILQTEVCLYGGDGQASWDRISYQLNYEKELSNDLQLYMANNILSSEDLYEKYKEWVFNL